MQIPFAPPPKARNAFKIISLEGNWDETINKERIEIAAAEFKGSDADFIIVSGTYDPKSSLISRPVATKLGERNSGVLLSLHDIECGAIIPAANFPFEYTYTIIEAFGNACVIGWLFSGFKQASERIRVTFAPISSGVHSRRVHLLNSRACQSLSKFNIAVEILAQEHVSILDNASVAEQEDNRLSELCRPGGVVATGQWFHGDEIRSFDDIAHMKVSMCGMIHNVLPKLSSVVVGEMAEIDRLSMRYFFMQLLGHAAIKGNLDRLAFNRIRERVSQRFLDSFDEAQATSIWRKAERGTRLSCM